MKNKKFEIQNLLVTNEAEFNKHDVDVDLRKHSLYFKGTVTIDGTTYTGHHQANDYRKYGFQLI